MDTKATDIVWTDYFPRIKKGLDDGKFKNLRHPVPLTPDYPTNVQRVMEFVWRCGRNAEVTARPEAVIAPVRDMWFIADHEHYEGIYYHCCESVRMMMFYTRYQHYFEQYREARMKPEMLHHVQDMGDMCRQALWGVFNCTGQNAHFHERDMGQFSDTEWRDVPRTRADDILEFHSCSRCIMPMPKQIVLVNKLQRSKLQDVF